MGTKKKKARKSRPPASNPPVEPEGGLTQEEFLERIRRARARKAGVEYQPLPSRPRKSTDRIKPSSPAFDPSLPPAAFPSTSTLNEPIPTGTREGHLRRVKEDSERRLQGLQPLPRESYHPGPILRRPRHVEAALLDEPIKTSSMDNSAFDARNRASRDINPGVEADRANASPAHSGNTGSGVAARCSGTVGIDGGWQPNPSVDVNSTDMRHGGFTGRMTSNPKWGDLPRSLRAEIMDNILESETWESAVKKIGLGRRQAKKAIEHLHLLHDVMHRESEQLEQELGRQLQGLLDNELHTRGEDSVRSKSILENLPGPLNASEKRILVCTMGDLRTAWHFLDDRGLPRDLAGAWTDGHQVIDPPEGEPRPKKRVRWKYPLVGNGGPNAETGSSPTSESSPSSQSSIFENLEPFLNLRAPSRTFSHTQYAKRMSARWWAIFSETNESHDLISRDRRLKLASAVMSVPRTYPTQDGPEHRTSTGGPSQLEDQYRQTSTETVVRVEPPVAASFTARDISEGIWLPQLEERYQQLADACARVCGESLAESSQDSPCLNECENEDGLLTEICQFDEQLQAILDAEAIDETWNPDIWLKLTPDPSFRSGQVQKEI